MKTFLVGLLLLLVSSFALAQGDSPGFQSACFTVTDGSCSEDGNCNNWSGAQSLTFTAPCTATYNFVCKVDCEQCYACGSCARLVEVNTGNIVSKCQSTLDVSGSCEWKCDNISYTGDRGHVDLTQGLQYRLDVMQQICPVTPSCGSCWNCTAKARVFHPSANCTAW